MRTSVTSRCRLKTSFSRNEFDLAAVLGHRPPRHRMIGLGDGVERVRHPAPREVVGNALRAEQPDPVDTDRAVGHIAVGVAVEKQHRRGIARPAQAVLRIANGSRKGDYPGVAKVLRELPGGQRMPVAKPVLAHQHRDGPGARPARHDPRRIDVRHMPADIGRGVVEVLRRHRKRHVQRLREMLLVEQAGLSGPLHPQPVVDRHDDEPLAGVVVEEGAETPVVPRSGHKAAAEKEHQAGFRPAVGRRGAHNGPAAACRHPARHRRRSLFRSSAASHRRSAPRPASTETVQRSETDVSCHCISSWA